MEEKYIFHLKLVTSSGGAEAVQLPGSLTETSRTVSLIVITVLAALQARELKG